MASDVRQILHLLLGQPRVTKRDLKHVAHLMDDTGHDLAQGLQACRLLKVHVPAQRFVLGAHEFHVDCGEAASALTIGRGQCRRQSPDDIARLEKAMTE
jgi:hypothetical protein